MVFHDAYPNSCLDFCGLQDDKGIRLKTYFIPLYMSITHMAQYKLSARPSLFSCYGTLPNPRDGSYLLVRTPPPPPPPAVYVERGGRAMAVAHVIEVEKLLNQRFEVSSLMRSAILVIIIFEVPRIRQDWIE